jgi:hypothetical protein
MEREMRRQRLAGGLTAAVGTAMMTNAVLGPLALAVIRFHESASMEIQLRGGELTSLLLAGPLAIVAGVLWWRGRANGPFLALGPLGYALYTNIQFVLAPDYARYPGNNERWFPLHLAVVMASWILGFAAWRELRARPLIRSRRTTTRLLGGLLLGINAVFALAWWASIATVYAGTTSLEYREHPTAFWLVRLMDLGFVIPIGTVTGLGLLRGQPWATRTADAFTGMQTLLACAVAAMAIQMWMSDASGASGVFAIVLATAASGFVVLYGLRMRDLSVQHRVDERAETIANARAERFERRLADEMELSALVHDLTVRLAAGSSPEAERRDRSAESHALQDDFRHPLRQHGIDHEQRQRRDRL